MIHRFNEAAYPIDTGAYTDIVFMGDSITVSGRTPEHFAAIAEGQTIRCTTYQNQKTILLITLRILKANIAMSNPELGLTAGSMYPDQVHPTELMGYIIALSLYCKIENLPTTEQNDGDLSPESIPGDKAEEKAQFMKELKAAEQEMLYLQK